MSPKPLVTFVVQRYGADIWGGAEQHCRQVAERMLKYWQVEVVTSCARDYLTWHNEFPPGRTDLDGVAVTRFPVAKPRDMEEFQRLSAEAFGSGNPQLEEQWARAQGPDCPELVSYLRDVRADRALFVFFSYLYYHSCFGIPVVADKAVLVPMAHDEPPLRLSFFNRVFTSPRCLLFNTLEEQKLIERRFAVQSLYRDIAGVGLPDCNQQTDEAIRLEARKKAPYCLYIGRIDYPKGVSELLHYFVHQDCDIRLVLAGEKHMEIPPDPRVTYLGEISDSAKRTLVQEAVCLVLPAPYESLSLSLLEALDQRCPVLANGNSAVLAGQVERSGGGRVYRDQAQFAAQLRYLAESGARRARMGMIGQRFVRAHYNWDKVERKYLETLRYVEH